VLLEEHCDEAGEGWSLGGFNVGSVARLAWSRHVNLENNERIYEVVSTPLHVKTLLSGSQDARDTGWR
jgi:hypothetical protein